MKGDSLHRDGTDHQNVAKEERDSRSLYFPRLGRVSKFLFDPVDCVEDVLRNLDHHPRFQAPPFLR